MWPSLPLEVNHLDERARRIQMLSVSITNRLAAVAGWTELGEETLALQMLLTCYEMLIQLHNLISSPSSDEG